MGKMRGAVLCACAIVAVAGCARTEPPYAARSLKDTAAARQPSAAPQPSIVERAKAEQASQCGERHVDHRKDTLRESEELKRDRDERCAELHRYDYVE
jgi:hypothetical protein